MHVCMYVYEGIVEICMQKHLSLSIYMYISIVNKICILFTYKHICLLGFSYECYDQKWDLHAMWKKYGERKKYENFKTDKTWRTQWK